MAKRRKTQARDPFGREEGSWEREEDALVQIIGDATVEDIGWTEAAREAALAARRAAARGAESISKWHQEAVTRAAARAREAYEHPKKQQPSIGSRIENVFFTPPKNLPFKVVQFDPKSGNYTTLASYNNLEAAKGHPGGNYIIQTHEWVPELTSHEPTRSSRTSMGKRAAGGFLLAGPIGAAVGALTTPEPSGGIEMKYKAQKLPESVIHPKDGSSTEDETFLSSLDNLKTILDATDNYFTVATMQMSDDIEIDDAAAVRVTDNGYLTAMPRVARTGIQLYRGSECGRDDVDTVRVYRPEDTVFDTAALKSFAHKPVTLGHPGVPVTSKNWAKFAKGNIGDEVLRDGGSVRVPMVLMDQATIEAFKEGKNQLSMGYGCDLEWRSGVTDSGEQYDAIQRNIRANHLALVTKARGGPELTIGDTEGDTAMELKTVLVDSISVQMSDTAAQVVQRTIKSLQDALENFKKKGEKKEEECDALTDEIKKKDVAIAAKDASIKDLEQKVKDAEITPAKMEAAVKDHVAVAGKAKHIMGDKFVTDGKQVADIRREVVLAKLGDTAKDYNAEYMKIAFDSIVATGAGALGVVDNAARVFAGRPGTGYAGFQGQMNARDQAYRESVEDLEDAYKPAEQRRSAFRGKTA